MRTLVYVHGTNGSGKSTLARAILTAAGGRSQIRCLISNPKARWTSSATNGVVLLGVYGNACGGVDGISPYADIHPVLTRLRRDDYHGVFAEGLITPGLKTCKELVEDFDQHLFIALATPLEQCVQNVLARRHRAGNFKPYDPANLYKKQRSVESWAKRLHEAGLGVQFLTYREAYRASLNLLGLHPPTLDQLLE